MTSTVRRDVRADTVTRWVSVLSRLTSPTGYTHGRRAKETGEAVRKLQQTWLATAMHVIASNEESSPFVLGITSATDGEGKTTNCLGLSCALARETDSRVIVLECDFGAPSMASALDLTPNPGLAEYVQSEQPIDDFILQTAISKLDLIVVGVRTVRLKPVLSREQQPPAAGQAHVSVDGACGR